MSLINCLLYIVISGVLVFFIGRVFPRKLIKENAFPFKSFSFEKEGKIYDKIKIKSWKTKLPDASVIITKILPNFMPVKRIKTNSKENIEILVKESCVAESTHVFAALLSLYCIKIAKKIGMYISLIYIFLNVPFILIQRYNRPRLKKLLKKYN